MHHQDFDLSIDQISKIEGHAAIDLVVREGKVKDLKFKVTDYKRFYTQAVRGKVIAAVPQHVCRICGTCSNAHLLCSIKALEQALEITPSEQTMLLRKLLTFGLMIRDHALHLYLFALPDILGKDSIFDFDEKDEREHQLLHDAFAVKAAGNILSKWVGGRSVHAPYPSVGGFIKIPARKEKSNVIEKLKDARGKVLSLIEVLLDCQFELEEDFTFAALDSKDFSFLDGDILSREGKKIKVDSYGEYLKQIEVKSSQASAYKLGEKKIMVGALARLNLIKDRLHSKTKNTIKKALSFFPSHNIFHNNLAQAIEVIHSIDSALDLLESSEFKPEPPIRITPKESQGIVAIEAPRGILFYHLKLSREGKVSWGQIVTPTNQNHLAIGQGVKDHITDRLDLPKDKIALEMEKVIRAFDPCMSCATHFLKVKWK